MNTRNFLSTGTSRWASWDGAYRISEPLRSTSLRILALPLLFILVGGPGDVFASSGEENGITFSQAPEGAKVISMSLSVPENTGFREQGYLSQRAAEPAAETTALPGSITDAYSGKEFSAYDVATLPDGTRYVVILNEDKTVKFLNRNESGMLYARLYRIGAETGAKPEILREGFQSSGNDVTVPVEMQLPGIGATRVKKLRTEIGYSLNNYQNGKFQVYTGRGAPIQLTGSELTKEGKLTATVTVPGEMVVTRETQVSLRFEPIVPGLPEHSALGKVTDFLTLGSARFVVTALEPDFSKITLAVVAGSLEKTIKEQLQVGAQMPLFSQVDLVSRRVVTREDLMATSKRSPIIFIFGDLVSLLSRNPYGPPPGSGTASNLPLPTPEIAKQLGLEMQSKPVVVFVTRQIGLDFLYGDLRNQTPDYFILSDFADPLKTTFRTPQQGPGGWYGPQYSAAREPSLRQLFNLPERTVSVAAFDSSGKVVYVKADAASEFLTSLAEARGAFKKRP